MQAQEDHAAYAAAATPIARLDLDGHIQHLNPAFAELFGAEPDQLLGGEFLDLLHPEDAASVRHGGLTSYSGGAVRADLRIMRADGRIIWARTAISLARDEDGMPSFLVVSLADVGDLKEFLFDRATGLPTRRLFDDRLSLALRAARRESTPLTVARVSLHATSSDGYALVDRHADHIADWLAAAVGAQVRNSDTVARLGLLEVALVLPGATELEARAVLARAGVPGAHAMDLAGEEVSVSASAGFAAHPADGDEAAALLSAAAPVFEVPSTEPLLPAFSISAAAAESALPNLLESEDQPQSEMELRVRALEPVPLFFSVPSQVLNRIARYTGREVAAQGEHVLVDETSASLRVVEEGLFEVLSSEGADVAVITLAPGDFLATDQALGEGPLGLRLRAAADSRMLVIEGDALEQVAPEGSKLRGALRTAAGQRNRQIRQLAQRSRIQTSARTATTTAIYSTKGGSGRTTTAINLAAELGRRHPGDVLLIDLALPYNHAALLANLVPTTCIARLANSAPESLGHLLRSAIIGHDGGFLVLPAALRPEEAELITADLVRRVIQLMAPRFNHLVIDLGLALSEEALAIIEHADRLLLLATPELTSMHDTRYVMELATNVLRVPSGAVDVVLNHRTPHSAMSRADVEVVLGRPLAAELRYMGERAEATGLAGKLLMRSATVSPFAKSIRELADRVDRTPARSQAV